ncbi:hypothetical protein [Thalassolituus sp.]|uniref:hypothetical protein n=1 Tax=Thalassolituus sp. TaxID=2030822 RepID=UPI00295678A9|nr:hypothetical protein [Ketobacter sp.]|tara:strand:- start:1632 stop:1910 length:279 start_codon:yes stop_codon:yes gene_type:complete
MTGNFMRQRKLIIEYTSKQMIMQKYGPLLSLEEIRDVLKYKTEEAVKKAYYKGTLPIKLVKIEGRAGLFCSAQAMADYIDQVDKEGSENVMA